MADLYYVVIAPKNGEIDQVVAELKAQNLGLIAQWLAQNKDNMYGRQNEDWRPFNGQTINQLVNETKGYQTATNLIDALDDDLSNLNAVIKSPVRIYFIDVFALFLKKYAKLANKIDALVALHGDCCLILSCELPREIQDQLLALYCRFWTEVCNSYRDGDCHRIAIRPDDFKNFRNFLLKRLGSEDAPSQVVNQQLNNNWKYQTTRPPSFATA
jgi:hypothetical protein